MKSSKQDNLSSFSSKFGAACMHILLVMNKHSWCVTASSVLTAKSSEAATMLLLQAAVAVGCCCCQLLLRSLAVAGYRLLLQAVAGCRLLLLLPTLV